MRQSTWRIDLPDAEYIHRTAAWQTGFWGRRLTTGAVESVLLTFGLFLVACLLVSGGLVTAVR
jgi:hypothetical protein